MRIAFVLPGLHRVVRGAEVAFEAIAHELSQQDDCDVTLFGSGQPRSNQLYKFTHVNDLDRKHFERWPQVPIFRNEYVYEEFIFTLNLLSQYSYRDFDVTVTCSYPFLNWMLRRKGGNNRPAHIFVTQNSDYPAITDQSEYKFFGCDGLVCTNPEYFERNKHKWPCELITNGVDTDKFFSGKVERKQFDLPEDVPIVLMVSALIPSKRISEGIKAIAQTEDLHLVICGDGPERENIRRLGEELLSHRFHWRKLSHTQMPDMYRTADIFMHLSLDEPFGNVYLEALATGLPIVSHNRDVTRWITEDAAILVDTEDSSQILAGLRSALNQRTDEDISARRALIDRRFKWSHIGSLYYSFMKQIV